ncbi:MAG: PAS domain-containing protein [Alphaproteobacteria bacterium]|nr:PAS domain-containing protein [Alphaproteobacteria bacterium]
MSISPLPAIAASAAELHPEPFWILDREVRFVWLNMAAQEWFGRSERALRGKPLSSLDRDIQEIHDLAERAIEEERTVVARQIRLRSRLVDLHLRWLADEDYLLVCLLPGTPNEASSDHGPALGFGRMLAHELKNPLASIRGAAQLIRNCGGDPEGAEMARLIIDDVDRIARLADHWSGVGDITLKSQQALNINQVVMAAIERIKRANPETLVRVFDDLDPSLPLGSGDADLLGQLVINLIQNAVDACETAESPRVIVRTSYTGAKRGKRSGNPVPLSISVVDNGAGIPASLQPNVFTPFVTSKPAGEGLGLAFCARIAELHSGILDFETRPGLTVFSLHLPQEALES